MKFMHGMYRDAGSNSGGNDAGGGSGSGQGGQNNQGGEGGLEQRLLDALNGLASRHGGMDGAGLVLLQENKQYRDRIKALEDELAAVKGKVPGEGAVVLNGEQVGDWTKYQELGKPDDLATVRSNYTQLQREQLYSQAAGAHGYKAGVLAKLPGMSDLSLEIREIEQDGNKVKVAYAKSGEGQERPLPDYVKETWGDFLPALQQKPDGQGTGTPWPRQNAGGQGPTVDPIQATLDKRYAPRKAQEK